MKVLVAHEEVEAWLWRPAGPAPDPAERGLSGSAAVLSPRFLAFWCNASEELCSFHRIRSLFRLPTVVWLVLIERLSRDRCRERLSSGWGDLLTELSPPPPPPAEAAALVWLRVVCWWVVTRVLLKAVNEVHRMVWVAAEHQRLVMGEDSPIRFNGSGGTTGGLWSWLRVKSMTRRAVL